MAESHIASWSYIAFFKGCQRKEWNPGTEASKQVPCLVLHSDIFSRQHANTYCNCWICKCHKLPLDQKCCSVFLTVNLFYEFLQIYSEIRLWLTGIIFDLRWEKGECICVVGSVGKKDIADALIFSDVIEVMNEQTNLLSEKNHTRMISPWEEYLFCV